MQRRRPRNRAEWLSTVCLRRQKSRSRRQVRKAASVELSSIVFEMASACGCCCSTCSRMADWMTLRSRMGGRARRIRAWLSGPLHAGQALRRNSGGARRPSWHVLRSCDDRHRRTEDLSRDGRMSVARRSPPAQGCFSTRAIASSTRPSLFSSPPPIPSDSATDRLRAVCSHCRSSASFISRDSWGCATISLGSEKNAVGSRRAVAKSIVDDAWPIRQSSLEGSQRMRLLPIEDYAMGRLTSRGCTVTGKTFSVSLDVL